jgi:hypothetical protein
MNISMNMVVRIKVHTSRPGRWNELGEMDEYTNELVQIESPNGRYVKPLSFKPSTERRWVFEVNDFCKANTLQPPKIAWSTYF